MLRSALPMPSLLEHIRRLPHGRATYKQLVRELRLQGEERESLEEALDRLSEKGAAGRTPLGPLRRDGEKP